MELVMSTPQWIRRRALCLVLPLVALLSAPALAQEPKAGPQDPKKRTTDLEKTLQDRVLQVRENLQAFFDRRKSQVIWGVESRRTRVLPSGEGSGTATIRFEFVWAQGSSEKDGKRVAVPYRKQGIAQFEFAQQKWHLVDL